MNYRSVVCFGTARVVSDQAFRDDAFRALLEHLVPGRWDDCRQPDAKESNATIVLSVPIDEASVKIRSGPPKDAEKDLGLGHWTGVIPLALTAGEIVPDPANTSRRPIPGYARDYARG